MKTFIHGVGLKDLSKDEADKIKARQSVTAPKKLDILRLERNRLLAETDHYALSDQTLSDDMKAYRQELRDITKKFKSMNDKDFKFREKPKD